MNNKPKYNIFKNTKYATDGLLHAIKTESSFRLELLVSIPVFIAIFLLDFELSSKLLLIITAFLILIIELINSSIENVVDLVATDIHPLAKHAKDIGATAVMFSITLHIICWSVVLWA